MLASTLLALAAAPAPWPAAMSPASRTSLFDPTAQNGKEYCTPILPPVERKPHLGAAKASCHIVAAAYQQTSSDFEVLRMLMPPACDLLIYDKDDPPCSFMPISGVTKCVGLPNVGREQHTFAHYTRTHYESGTLADVVFFVAADISHHDRAHSVQRMLNNTVFNETVEGGGIVGPNGGSFWCINETAGVSCDGFKQQLPMPVSTCRNCSMHTYCRGGGTANCVQPTPTIQPTFLGYMQANVGDYSPGTMDKLCHLPLCHYGVAATTKANLLAHPVQVYANIEATLNQTVMPEAIWMMEWGMAVAYGAGGVRELPVCHDGPIEACPFGHT